MVAFGAPHGEPATEFSALFIFIVFKSGLEINAVSSILVTPAPIVTFISLAFLKAEKSIPSTLFGIVSSS